MPLVFAGACSHAPGITGRAVERGLLRLERWNPRDFTSDRHRTVDDRPYGGGPGMVMRFEPLRDAIDAARTAMGPRQRHLLGERREDGFLLLHRVRRRIRACVGARRPLAARSLSPRRSAARV